MKQSYVKKVALDSMIEQLKWSLWFVGIMVILHIAASVLSTRFDYNITGLFEFSFTSTPVCMFVIAIIAGAYFLPLYIKQGVTRKNYFLGCALGSIILSASLTIVFMALSFIGEQILSIFNITFIKETILFNQNTHSVVIVLIYFLNTLLYYLIGWLIYAAYYRFGLKIGFCSILFAILSAFLHGILWANYTPSVAIISTLFLIVIYLVLIRWITRKVPIRI